MVEYIEREAAIKAIENDLPEQVRYSREDAADCIRYMETADVAPVRHGRIIETIENGRMKRVFSCCETDFTKMTCWMTPNYCPECGAKIDKEKSE